MPNTNIEEKKKHNLLAPAAALTAGGIAGGAGAVDLRKSNLSKGHGKYFGKTWDKVKKHIRPGDVAIGAPYGVDDMASGLKYLHKQYSTDVGNMLQGKKTKNFYANTYKNDLKKVPKWLPNVVKKHVVAARMHVGKYGDLDIPTVLSKFHNPDHPHGELFVTKNKVMFAGGNVTTPVGRGMMAKDLNSHRKLVERKMFNPHYTILRHKDPKNDLLMQHFKQHGAKKTSDLMSRKAGIYNTPMSIGGWAKDALIPKLSDKERPYSKAELLANKKCTGGVCSTAPALMNKTTVGGKSPSDVLPSDYLKSKNYKVVGHIGPVPKTSLKWRAVLSTPKLALRTGVGMAVGGAVYGGVKGVQKLTEKKPMEKKSSYEFGLADELEKLSAKINMEGIRTELKRRIAPVVGSAIGGAAGGTLGWKSETKDAPLSKKILSAIKAGTVGAAAGYGGGMIKQNITGTGMGNPVFKAFRNPIFHDRSGKIREGFKASVKKRTPESKEIIKKYPEIKSMMKTDSGADNIMKNINMFGSLLSKMNT